MQAPDATVAHTPEPRLPITMLVADSLIDRRVLDQARTLNGMGAEVTVIAGPKMPRHPNPAEEIYPDVRIVRLNTARTVRVPRFDDPKLPEVLRRNWMEMFKLHAHFVEAALAHPASVYVAHDLPQLSAAAVAASYAGAYLVYDAHELYPERQFFPIETIYQLREVEERLFPLVDHFITVNTSIANVMASRYPIKVPQVVLNCPDMHGRSLPVAPDPNLRSRLGLPSDQRILMFQGNFNINRNLVELVTAMRLVTREDVVLVCMGSGGLQEQMQAEARRLNLLGSRVFFHPKVAQHELLACTAAADVGIIPYPHIDLNTYFCTPNKLFEFIVAGLPILANDSPELNRFVGGQGIGLNHPMRTPADIAAAIDACFGHAEFATWRTQVQSLSARYTWGAESATLMQGYISLGNRMPQAQYVAHMERARMAANVGNTQEMEALLTTVSTHWSDASDEVALLRASHAQQQGRYSDAIAQYRSILKVKPDHTEAFERLLELRDVVLT